MIVPVDSLQSQCARYQNLRKVVCSTGIVLLVISILPYCFNSHSIGHICSGMGGGLCVAGGGLTEAISSCRREIGAIEARNSEILARRQVLSGKVNDRWGVKFNTFRQEFPELSVCICKYSYEGVRDKLLKAGVDASLNRFKNKNEVFTLVSVGAGQCFEEAHYLASLVAQGCQKIHLVVIDEANMTKSVNDLKAFIEKYIADVAEIKITYYKNVKECQAKPNLLLLLDLDTWKLSNGRGGLLPQAERSLFTLFSQIKGNLLNSTVINYTQQPFTDFHRDQPNGVCCLFKEGVSDLNGCERIAAITDYPTDCCNTVKARRAFYGMHDL